MPSSKLTLTPSGVVTPEKYSSQGLPVGPYYMHYGEQPGFIYDPYTDRYTPDPNVANNYYEQAGLAEKPDKGPSAAEQIGYLGGAALVSSGGTALGQAAIGGGTAAAGGTAGATGAGAVASTSTASGLPAAAGYTGTGAATSSGAAATTGGTASSTGSGTGLLSGSGAANAAAYGSGLYFTAKGAKGTYDAYNRDEWDKEDETRMTMTAIDPYASALYGIEDTVGGNMAYYLSPFGKAADVLGIDRPFQKIDTAKEEKRLSKLRDEGRYNGEIRAEDRSGEQQFKDNLDRGIAEDFVGFTPEGEWVNMKFAKSRDVKDLRPTDITGYAAFFEKYDDWINKTQEEKESIAQQYLDAGAVSEEGGTIYLDDKKFNDKKPVANVGLLANADKQAENKAEGTPGRRPGKNWNAAKGKYEDIRQKPRTRTDEVFSRV